MRQHRLLFFGAFLALWSAAHVASLHAQEFRATITGIVSDPSGAAIPLATIKAVQLDTRQDYAATCDTAGVYALPYLMPGKYSVSVEAPGFQKTVYDNVMLEASERLSLNVTLALASVGQQMTVTADPGLLDADTASVTGVVNQAHVVNLPGTTILGWDNLAFIQGVQYTGGFNTTPDSSAKTGSVSGVTGGNAFYINGAPVSDQGAFHMTPDLDSIQEMQGGIAYDAQNARASGGTFNIIVKQGTNSFHGDAFDTYTDKVLDSNDYTANLTGLGRKTNSKHEPGGVLGGPIRQDKTFFFASWGAWYANNGVVDNDSVPPQSWRTGDFSQSGYSLYDPLTSACTATNAAGACTTYKRTQFPNNIIPASRISPIGQAILNLYPAPNLAGVNSNYATIAPKGAKYNQWLGRVDQYFSENTRMYGTFQILRNFSTNAGTGLPGIVSTTGKETGLPYNAILAITHVFSPALVLDAKLSFMRYTDTTLVGEAIPQDFTGDKIGGLRMPLVPTTTELNVVPDVTVNGYTALFGNTDNGTVNNTWDFSTSLSQIHGKHNLHYGFEFFDDQNATSGVPGDPYGTFGFNVGWTQSNPLTATSGQGLGAADLLLGYPTSGSVDWDSNQLVKYHYYGLFIQDEYKLRKNLTINLGLRWDVNGSPSERHDSMNAGFCLTCPNPYTQQINYKQYPNLVDPLTGGWLFAGAGQPAAPFKVQLNHWQPRFGISWAVTDKWVVRAGYGLFYSFNNTAVDSQGFNQNTSYVSSLDGNLTPTNYFLSGHPYPNGVLAPSGSSAGLGTLAGTAISYDGTDRVIPYVQRWSIGVQRALPQRMLVDVEYIGNHSHALPVSTPLDVVSGAQQAACYANSALCNANVANPFYGVLPAAAALGASATVQAYQLMRPYPLFNGISETTDPVGESDYHSLNVRLERKVANLDFVYNYAYSNWMGATSYLNSGNFVDQKLFRGLDNNDRRHYMNVSMVYPLPFGKGRLLARNAKGILQAVIGNWLFDSTVVWGSGNPLALPAADFSGPGCTSLAPTGGQDAAHWFNNNMSCWHNLAPWEARTLPLNVGYLRDPGEITWNPSLNKSFALPREGMFLQLRVNALNGGNITVFGNPAENLNTLPKFTPWVGWSGFGTTSLSGGDRIVTVQVKLLF